MSASCLLPEFDSDQVAAAAQQLYGLAGPFKKLHGERDLNFLIVAESGKYVFKIANAAESVGILECQHEVFQRLADARVFDQVATALPSVNNQLIESVSGNSGEQHYCRVLPYLEGRMWSDVEGPHPQLLTKLGKSLARLDQALDSFQHAGLQRPLLWNMELALEVLEQFKPELQHDHQRQLVSHFEAGFRKRVLPVRDQLRRSTIHNDANRENVIVDDANREVVSIIDFGDMLHTWLVLEPSIAATYAMMGQDNPLDCAQALLRGYHQELPLTRTEIELVIDLVCMRLCMSVCICAHQLQLEPDNTYLSIDEQDSWELLEKLQALTRQDIVGMMLDCCPVDQAAS